MPLIIQEICFDLLPVCGNPIYMQWKDKAGGYVYQMFEQSQIESISTEDGEDFTPYVYDVQEVAKRELPINIISYDVVRCFVNLTGEYYSALQKTIFDAIEHRVYLGLLGTVDQWVYVRIIGGTKGDYVNTINGLYRFEVEFQYPKNWTSQN